MSEHTPNNAAVLGGARAWFIWALAALAFGYAFFHRVAPSVMVSELMQDFAIGGAMLGILSALYFYPYVLMQIPLGALLDNLGARTILVVSLTTASIGSILFGLSEVLWLAYAGRILIGVGCSVGFLGSLSLASRWFPANRFAFMSGLTMFCAMISGIAAQAPLAFFVEAFGWRASMWALGVFGAALALLIHFVVQDAPGNPIPSKAAKKPIWRPMVDGLRRAASSWEVWKIALVASTMSGPMLTLGALWGTPYLETAFNLERPEAAFYTSLTLFGWAIGAPLAGWVSDKLQRRKILINFSCAMTTTALGILVFVPASSLVLTTAALIAIGFFGGTMAISFALVREQHSPEISGSAIGIVNGMTVASGALLQPLVGLVLDALNSDLVGSNATDYVASDYQWGFILIFLTALTGFIGSLFLSEKRHSPQ